MSWTTPLVLLWSDSLRLHLWRGDLLVIYVWVTAASPRQDDRELRQMLVRYLSTQQHKPGKFKAPCTTPTVPTTNFQATYTEAQLALSLGSSDCTLSSHR